MGGGHGALANECGCFGFIWDPGGYPPQTLGWIYAEHFKSSLKMKAKDKRRRG